MKNALRIGLSLLLVISIIGCGGKSKTENNAGDAEKEEVTMTPAEALAAVEQGKLPAWESLPLEELKDGLMYIDLKKGDGPAVYSGQKAEVHYTGWLKTGRKFDSSHNRNETFKFDLGIGKVIRGWDMGVEGMTIGTTRLLVIPSKLGYGSSGAGSVIPPNATLIFAVELVGFE